jgi:hypothetical protein
VVGHQHVGVDGAAEFVGKLVEVVQVELVVLLGMEADRAIVAALDDVPGDAGESKTRAAGHGTFQRCEKRQDSRK